MKTINQVYSTQRRVWTAAIVRVSILNTFTLIAGRLMFPNVSKYSYKITIA